MSTLRISNIEAKSVPASATIDEKVKITNSSGDTLVFIDGKTSGITTVGINTTDPNITFDANSNVVVTGVITATRFSGQITPTSLEIGSNIKLGNAGVITATSFVGSGANLTNLPSQVTITGNANDKVITGGSGTNLVGETRLTFDGNSLDITGAGTHPFAVGGGDYRNLIISGNSQSSSGFIYLGNGAATNNADFDLGRIRIYNGATQVAQISGTTDTSANDDGRITLHTRNTGGSLGERLRISNDGRVLINTTAVTNTNDQLTVKRPASGFGEMTMTVDANTSTSSAANAFIFTKSKHTYWNGYGFQSSHGHIGAIVARRDSTGGDSDQEIRIEIGGTHINQSEEKTWNFKNNGDLSISDGNLVIGTSGHGIDFSATGGPLTGTGGQELLDDYEEGTWQPSGFVGGGSLGTNGATYTKIGCVVYIYFYVTSMNIPNNGNQFQINGLPFTVTNANDHYPPLTIGYTGNGNLPAEVRFLFAANNTHVYSHTTGGTGAVLTNSTMRGYLLNHPLLCSGFYFTNS